MTNFKTLLAAVVLSSVAAASFAQTPAAPKAASAAPSVATSADSGATAKPVKHKVKKIKHAKVAPAAAAPKQ